MSKIDHLGIAVRSIADARRFYESMGLQVLHHEEMAEEDHLRVAVLPLGESCIELLEPMGPGGSVARFLDRHGEGLHHVAFHMDDISGTFEAMKQAGVRLLSEEIQIGSGGHLYFFVDPASSSGVLVEICQDSITGV